MKLIYQPDLQNRGKVIKGIQAFHLKTSGELQAVSVSRIEQIVFSPVKTNPQKSGYISSVTCKATRFNILKPG
jgi:hypothetical protein